MTERLYYKDAYLKEFRANVTDVSPDGLLVYLDRTAFYPTSGGQPFDVGTLGGATVLEVVDEEDQIAHRLAEPLREKGEVAGAVDWARRFDHMQQHTGQHLLSAVLIELFEIPTVSFHLGAETSTIDVSATLDERQVERAEQRANELVFENRPVRVEFRDAKDDLGLRKETKRTGEIRIVEIAGVDRNACGGTHVRATGEIGPILLRRLEKVRGNTRVEFVCGGRAVETARRDFRSLSAAARAFSAPLERVAEMAGAQQSQLQAAEKERLRLLLELAQMQGRQLFAETAAGPDGVRRVERWFDALDDSARRFAQSFAEGGKAIFLGLAAQPPSVLLAVSPDAGMHAGNVLKAELTQAGGRGGGNAGLAQGSLPSKEQVELLAERLRAR